MEIFKQLRTIFVKGNYYFLVGTQFFSLVNFGLIVLAASDTIKQFIPVKTSTLLIFLIPFAFVGALSFGFFMDRVVHYQEHAVTEKNKRDPQIQEILQIARRLELRK